MHRLLLTSLLFALVPVSAAVPVPDTDGPTPTVVNVLCIEYPPFTSESLPNGGISIELLRERLDGSGIEIAPRFLPPARIQQTMNGEIWHASYVPSPEENEMIVKLILKNASFMFGLFRVREDDAFKWTALSELAGKQIAVTRALKLGAYNAMMAENGARIVYVDDIAQGFRMLEHRRVDYVLAIQETGWYLMDILHMKRADYQFSESVLDRFPYALYVNKTTPQGQALIRALTMD